MTRLSTLIYVSNSLIDDPDSIGELLTASRETNQRRNITGVLILHAGRFLQVLEGTPHDVDVVYSRIERDRRHENVRLLLNGPIAARRFGRWSMAFHNPDEVPAILGAISFDELRQDAGRAGARLLDLVESMVTSDSE